MKRPFRSPRRKLPEAWAAARALVAPFHPRWVWPAIAFPPVFLCLMQGQTGLLAAALLGGGLLALRPRPVLAGVLFGLLTVKPQLGLLLPFALTLLPLL